MGVSAVQGFVQNLLNQPPKPEDVERNTLLKTLGTNTGLNGPIVKAVNKINQGFQ